MMIPLSSCHHTCQTHFKCLIFGDIDSGNERANVIESTFTIEFDIDDVYNHTTCCESFFKSISHLLVSEDIVTSHIQLLKSQNFKHIQEIYRSSPEGDVQILKF